MFLNDSLSILIGLLLIYNPLFSVSHFISWNYKLQCHFYTVPFKQNEQHFLERKSSIQKPKGHSFELSTFWGAGISWLSQLIISAAIHVGSPCVLRVGGETAGSSLHPGSKISFIFWFWMQAFSFLCSPSVVLSPCDALCVGVCMLNHFSCVWLCDPVDCSPPGSSMPGILQARIPECIAICFSRGSSRPKDRTHVSYLSCIGRQDLYH